MRIVMPLFEFEYYGSQPFTFTDCDLSIAPFDAHEIPRIPLFSAQDIHHMEAESWALIYDGTDAAGYKVVTNLLLMSFRIFSDHHPPFVKYRLASEASNLSGGINQPMTYNFSADSSHDGYQITDFALVDTGFQHLRRMEAISARTHNALYFLYRAFHSHGWIDAFLLMMNALESLFSKDAPGGAARTIATRVTSLLGSQTRCTKADIEALYDLRSAMTHGRLVANDNPGENLRQLEHLEFVSVRCIRELIARNAYTHYASKADRDRFMGTLNTSA